MPEIIDVLAAGGARPDTMRITDIGAMESSSSAPWSGLIERGAATLLGFEPQAEECARCNSVRGSGYRYLPEALGDGTVRVFHRCRCPETSSFYKPNGDVIHQFNGLTDLMEVVEVVPMPTKRLDDIQEARRTDLLKLDVQGAELDILKHAKATLEHVSIIQIEVSFLPLYVDQPLFADVDRFLRGQGFVLHTFLGFGMRTLKPLAHADNPYAGIKQTLWSDVVYTRLPGSPAVAPDPAAFLKRAVLFHELYQSYDFAARALKDHDDLTGTRLIDAYTAMLGAQKAA